MKTLFNNYIKLGFALTLTVSLLFFGRAALAAPSYAVTFTFDDAWLSQYENAFPILSEANQKATLYVPTSLVGSQGYMSWQNIIDLVLDGWEIAGHSATHAELPTLTPEQIQEEVEKNFATLEAHGLLPADFATPYGAYDPTVIANIASYFSSHRAFHNIGFNSWPYNKYLLHVQPVTNQTTPAEIDAWIQEAVANNYWLIIVFHEILPTVAPEDTHSWTEENLTAVMSMLESNGVELQTVAEVLNMKESLFANSDFLNGIGDGWETTTPDQVSPDEGRFGSVPTPDSSIKMVGGPAEAYLYSPAALVSNAIEYGVRIFTNTINLVSGELGFYIDEYNEADEWVSGKYLGVALPGDVIDESYTYQPTSAQVVSAKLQTYLSAGAVGHVFVDNATLFEEGQGDPLPIPDPRASLIDPPPLPNSDFSNGLNDGWNTDNSGQVSADTTSKGISPTVDSSIKIVGDTPSAHLFSPKALVDAAQSYDVSAFVNAAALTTGEIGLYVDEYNSEGNWISGRWITMMSPGGTGEISSSYTPTSDQVTASSLQVYLTGNATGEAFVDNVEINGL
jgi:peptidoglycan/xylan/chitin deacetylase (PgdA/CDA1 family)